MGDSNEDEFDSLRDVTNYIIDKIKSKFLYIKFSGPYPSKDEAGLINFVFNIEIDRQLWTIWIYEDYVRVQNEWNIHRIDINDSDSISQIIRYNWDN